MKRDKRERKREQRDNKRLGGRWLKVAKDTETTIQKKTTDGKNRNIYVDISSYAPCCIIIVIVMQ